MLYIQKKKASAAVSKEINRIKEENNWDNLDYKNTQVIRSVFDMLDKETIRTQLLEEQGSLCAYCMRKISNNDKTTIEHFIPITLDGKLALNYKNMLACCDGGRGSTDKNKILSCDAAKGDQSITISPLIKEHVDKIRYNKDGFIHLYPEDDKLMQDIKDVLKLNGEYDDDGNYLSDTSTMIVSGRRQAYSKAQQIIAGLAKRKKLNEATIRKMIEDIKSASEKEEYAGVLLYVLRRKLREI